nr:MAG TPA: Recombination enhancement, RecA-dependent nuclease [Caudoviricetes sp.]
METKACWLCGRNGSTDPLDKHHLFGAANRDKSERYGLYVYLCHSRCHIFGSDAVHRNPETMHLLHEYGQRKAMREQGWIVEDFRREFGKNYLED